METPFIPVADKQGLEQLLTRSHDAPIVVFKHSLTCPISSAAYQQMSRLQGDVALVVVQRARDVSREVETRTGVRHESPQVILLRNGQAVWNASHWAITTDKVEQAVRKHA